MGCFIEVKKSEWPWFDIVNTIYCNVIERLLVNLLVPRLNAEIEHTDLPTVPLRAQTYWKNLLAIQLGNNYNNYVIVETTSV